MGLRIGRLAGMGSTASDRWQAAAAAGMHRATQQLAALRQDVGRARSVSYRCFEALEATMVQLNNELEEELLDGVHLQPGLRC